MQQGIAHRLKIARKELKLTQEQMGEKCGIKKSGYSMIENGNANLTPRNLTLLSSSLGINKEWIVTGDGDMFVTKANTPVGKPWLIPSFKFTPVYEVSSVTPTNTMSEDDIIRYVPFCNTGSDDIAILLIDKSMTPDITINSILLIGSKDGFDCELDNGKLFFVILKDGRRFVRYIYKSAESSSVIVCKSPNKNYDDTEIKIDNVIQFYIVKARYYDSK